MADFVTLNFRTNDIAPSTVLGFRPFPLPWAEMNWLQELPKNTYFALWLKLPSVNSSVKLPPGHNLYVISFHSEHFDLNWLLEQTKKINSPIIVLNDGGYYDSPLPPNVYFFNYYSWHQHLNTMMSWFPDRHTRQVKYKVSAVCNRITQSKMLIFTAIMKYLDQNDCMIKLGNWLEEKNVHYRQPTNVALLDELSDIFFNQYFGKTIEIDGFTNETHNVQRKNSNPWQPLYTQAALHFTNETYHYSLMQNEQRHSINPGPAYSEKTFKCLIAGTPFIAVGQFDSYRFLKELGLKFDYGDIDLSWDNDPGNLSRIEGIINMIKSISEYNIADIEHMTGNSTQHNTDFIWSGDFYNKCQTHNNIIANTVITQFR
jgi:hypothetical protein